MLRRMSIHAWQHVIARHGIQLRRRARDGQRELAGRTLPHIGGELVLQRRGEEGSQLRRAQQQIETAGKTVEGIITTRTNVMERKLKDIDALEDAREADEILGLTSAGPLADQKDED